MDMPTSGKEIQSTEAPPDGQEKNTRTATRAPSIIVGTVAAIVVALSVFYLLRREPLLVQGEADGTQLRNPGGVWRRGKGKPLQTCPDIPSGGVFVRIVHPANFPQKAQNKAPA